MGEQLQPMLSELKQKVLGDREPTIHSDEEYYCAVGQAVYYLLSLNKASKRTHAMINPILNSKEDGQIKMQLRRLFVKYNYAINQNSGRFNRLYGMVLGYTPTTKVDEDALLYGYLQDNLVYSKGEN